MLMPSRLNTKIRWLSSISEICIGKTNIWMEENNNVSELLRYCNHTTLLIVSPQRRFSNWESTKQDIPLYLQNEGNARSKATPSIECFLCFRPVENDFFFYLRSFTCCGEQWWGATSRLAVKLRERGRNRSGVRRGGRGLELGVTDRCQVRQNY